MTILTNSWKKSIKPLNKYLMYLEFDQIKNGIESLGFSPVF